MSQQDIRRMTREDLDRLNAESKAWRERNNPLVATPPTDTVFEERSECIATVQMGLFGEQTTINTEPSGILVKPQNESNRVD